MESPSASSLSTPPSVPPGSDSALTLVLQNCTSQTIQGSTAWYGQCTGQSCPVLDPVPYSYAIAPGGTYTLTNSSGGPGFPGCQPTALKISANVNVNGAETVTTVTATLQFNAACTNGIAINQFSFSPGTVPASQTSTLTLVLRNCTNQTVQGSSAWYPEFTWAGTGQPPGCPVMDPVSFNYSMAPGGTSTATLGLGDPLANCQATGIQATVNVYVNGVTEAAATATANLVITQSATGGCRVPNALIRFTTGPARHHDPHFGKVPGAGQRYKALLRAFRKETGSLTGTSLAAACGYPPSHA